MIYLINYANKPYAKMQKFQSYTAKNFGGIDKIIEYSDSDIYRDKTFYLNNKKILDIKKGNGLFLWKPYIILKTLQKLGKDDILIYCDVDTIFIDDVKPLTQLMKKKKSSLMVFDSPNFEYEYTKYNLCQDLGLLENSILESRQRYASYSLYRKTKYTLGFIQEWLNTCTIYDHISDEVKSYHPTYGQKFVHNLQDQSIFSLLTKKHRIEAFRDPSNWGNNFKKEYGNSFYDQLLYNGVAESRKLWLMTYLFGKAYLTKKFKRD
ncbi:MAG: hypothetical protein ACE362_25145 [Phaeodactylibacter xiamenensis]|uniref:Nucleotide-diphospho-sugar transferase domain-containing protein n=1 Tax=Phaeodactylibacter xiamenensis TaxID=1524460 RepID=A0A098S5V6_9BACT|nr:hypothetical protein [Phaeodactylibacter xiamenensis]KGE86612.1 hypothetical protein IX84_20175 [Phaeodactylibacter xiamenensis]MCR9053994.1 hypothetical protein [bacterium]